jgi:hypothetical protein
MSPQYTTRAAAVIQSNAATVAPPRPTPSTRHPAGQRREVDGGVLVLRDDHDLRPVRQGDAVADGGRVVQPSAGGAVGRVEVGEVDARRVRRQ